MKTAILGAMAAILIASPAHAAGVQDFTLHNNLNAAITHVYVSESDNPKWENDVLGKDVLENGDSWDIKFTGYGDAVCKFDIKIKTQDDAEWIVEGVNLCEMQDIKFSMEGGKVVFEKN
ncbi:MAG: uncharacterized protein JWM80_3092 [Cyanobacteria bacterium RYN_339]|nr:uncharacterized protein [Cyanobacteria bacterium RYN_339]